MRLDDPRLADRANVGNLCIWRDCEASFFGDMPEGWTWHISYHDARPTIVHWTRHDWWVRPYQDTCLCPEHSRQLERMFKIGSEIKTPAGTA
jgi:hypothetical protein